jgi:cobalt-zinc-cadmium efflux system protein
MSEQDKHHHYAASDSLAGAIALNLAITGAEIAGGIASGSLALISDALHNFSDVVALAVSGIALRLGRQPRTLKYTVGLKRAEILAATLNAVVLVVICVFLVREALVRFHDPFLPSGMIMIVVGAIGLLANAGGTLLLHRHANHNLNLRSAYLHMLGDTVSSVGVVLGGISVSIWSVTWIDPIITCMIAAYVLWESYKILRDTTNIMMMSAPSSVSIDKIHEVLCTIPGVENVHHVHLWQLSESDVHFEAHVSVRDMRISEAEHVIFAIESVLSQQFGIRHVTIQCECDRCGSQQLIIP